MERDKTVHFIFDFMPELHRKLFKGMKHDYTRHQVRLLHFVEKDGENSMKHYGQKLLISKPNMSTLVDRMVEDSLIERLYDPKDRRVVRIKVSETGKKVLRSHEELMKETIKEKLIPISDEEIKVLNDSLEVIKKIFNKIGE